MKKEDTFASTLAQGLASVGFAYVDGFLGEPLASYVRQEVYFSYFGRIIR